MNKHEKFKSVILSSSIESKSLLSACGEWELIGIRTNKPGICICGKVINNIFTIQNTKTLRILKVGSVHVKFFDDLDPNSLINCITRISKDINKKPNTTLIRYAKKTGILRKTNTGEEKEYHFLLSICRKRKLTEKQRERLIKINRRILAKVRGRTN